MAKSPTLADLNAQRTEIEKQIAQAQLPALQAINDALNGAAAQELLKTLADNLPGLADGPAKQSAGHIQTLIGSARNVLARTLQNATTNANGGAQAPAEDAE